ncbi:MAG: helix-turn-helix domain-containing protein [Fusicatenibacter sp.]|nr:helix-turn-helix domain-containing protein [Fusicatenibacter sp.]
MKYKLLVAEDEMIERKVLIRTLNKNLGEMCEIYEAKNGREALEIARREIPCIALLDIEMPGISGLEVARRIRENRQECVILFLTAYDNFVYAQQAISIRALDYILKPYDENELIFSVEEAMRVYDQLTKHDMFREYHYRVKETNWKHEEKGDERLSYVREKISAYLEENYSRELSMQEVARAMNYSDAYFCKLFKECFQINFSAYLNEYRVEKAKKLLLQSNTGIREISEACGYSDSNYFTRVFKRITGMTPSEYRLDQAEKREK